MDSEKLQILIEMIRSGNATGATEELLALDKAQKAVTASGNQVNVAQKEIAVSATAAATASNRVAVQGETVTKTLSNITKEGRAFGTVMNGLANVSLLAGNAQLATMAMTANQAASALKAASAAGSLLKFGGAAGLGLAGVGAGLAAYTTYSYTEMLKAQMAEGNTGSNLASQNDRQAASIKNLITFLQQQKEIEKDLATSILDRVNAAQKSRTAGGLNEGDYNFVLRGASKDLREGTGFNPQSLELQKQQIALAIENQELAFRAAAFGKNQTEIDQGRKFDLDEQNRKLQQQLGLIRDQLTLTKTLDAMTPDEQAAREGAIHDAEREATAIRTKIEANNEEIQTLKEKTSALAQVRLQLRNIDDGLGTIQQNVGQFVGGALQNFSSGMGNALVQMAADWDHAGDHLKQFLAQFMQATAQMIAQSLILRAVSSLFGSLAGPSAATTAGVQNSIAAGPTFRAFGGQTMYAANGIQTVSSPTFLPKFNVVAGERAMELLTVMANPRMMKVGGMATQVGDVGSRTMALTDVNDLANGRGGAGGRVDIVVSMEPGLKVDIINQAADVSVRKVINGANSGGPVRDAIASVNR